MALIIRLFFIGTTLLVSSYLRIELIKKRTLLKLLSNVSKRLKIDIQASDCDVRFNKIMFEKLFLRKGAIEIRIDRLIVSFAFKHPSWIVINVNEIQIQRNSLKTSRNNSSASENMKMDFINIYQQINRQLGFVINTSKRCKIMIQNIDVNKNGSSILSARNFVLKRSKISFILTPGPSTNHDSYEMHGLLKMHSLNYTIKPIKTNKNSVISFNKSIGKFSWDTDKFRISNYTTHATIFHEKICIEHLKIARIKSFVQADIAKDQIALNSQSFFQINGMLICPKYIYDSADTDFVSLTFLVDLKPEIVLNLIPNLRCPKLNHLKSSGSISIRIMLAFLRSDPHSYNFKLDYDIDGFEIENPGIELYDLNNEFIFYPKFQEEIDNKKFIHVKTACGLEKSLAAKVIQDTEDPHFYAHNGFDTYFIGRSIAINLAQRRFVKGASTITMQMVKNLYLDNDKNLIRKAEEMILTVLIENYFKIPKERILEIYLQIIQFGPDVYGIHQGSQFYFGKNVSELSLIESLVMSYIIPRPNFFLEAVQLKSEQLNRNLSKHIETYFPIMGKKFEGQNKTILTNTIQFREEIGSIYLSYLQM